MLHVLNKVIDDLASNIDPISVPFFEEFIYEMLMRIGMGEFDLVAWLEVTGFAMGHSWRL
jgi:hypothetical protein